MSRIYQGTDNYFLSVSCDVAHDHLLIHLKFHNVTLVLEDLSLFPSLDSTNSTLAFILDLHCSLSCPIHRSSVYLSSNHARALSFSICTWDGVTFAREVHTPLPSVLLLRSGGILHNFPVDRHPMLSLHWLNLPFCVPVSTRPAFIFLLLSQVWHSFPASSTGCEDLAHSVPSPQPQCKCPAVSPCYFYSRNFHVLHFCISSSLNSEIHCALTWTLTLSLSLPLWGLSSLCYLALAGLWKQWKKRSSSLCPLGLQGFQKRRSQVCLGMLLKAYPTSSPLINFLSRQSPNFSQLTHLLWQTCHFLPLYGGRESIFAILYYDYLLEIIMDADLNWQFYVDYDNNFNTWRRTY